jgi:hypothetical protein
MHSSVWTRIINVTIHPTCFGFSCGHPQGGASRRWPHERPKHVWSITYNMRLYTCAFLSFSCNILFFISPFFRSFFRFSFVHSFVCSPSLFYLLTVGVEVVYFHLITLRHTPQSVGLLWTRDRPVAEASTWQHKHSQETNIHVARWDWNPRSQQVLGRRPTP